MGMLALAGAGAGGAETHATSVIWVWPFVTVLLAIAILPLIPKTHHWWEENRNKLLVALCLSAITLGYYYFRGHGVEVHDVQPISETIPVATHPAEPPHGELATGEHEEVPEVRHYSNPGFATVVAVLRHAILAEYIPFIVLLFSLYVISGGIVVRGDIRATPAANTSILAIGGLLASLIGTTGASMVLIRLLLKTNRERKRVVHTVIFFIFVVSNVGGTLLPIGDPPLFLGYLRGVPFLWTLTLWKEWLVMMGALLVVYYLWDLWAYRHEEAIDIQHDEEELEPIHVHGLQNLVWLVGVVLAVALLDPEKAIPFTNWHAFPYMREGVQLLMVALAWVTTSSKLRADNSFNFVAIGEVACLFIGIFITMQVPLEILHGIGPQMQANGFTHPWQFFWATGILSSFLDNAPTYVVFFETASTLTTHAGPHTIELVGGGHMLEELLTAVSVGAVFMGANTYIGNGPNFMVKSIAEQGGVKMPSFFAYMLIAILVLGPLYLLITFVFFNPLA